MMMMMMSGFSVSLIITTVQYWLEIVYFTYYFGRDREAVTYKVSKGT